MAELQLTVLRYSTYSGQVVLRLRNLYKGHRWDQDDWFNTLQHLVNVETGYGISTNRDLNDVEIKLANAIKRGLHI